MKKIFLLICFIAGLQLSAQNDEAFVDEQVTQFTGKLESRGISQWFTTKRFCLGSIEMFQMENGRMCTSRGTYYEVYVVWEEEGTTMLKKIDNCGLFYSIPLKTNELTEFVTANFTDLEQNSVRPYKANNISGKPESRTEVHACRRAYTFRKNGAEFQQAFKMYDITTSDKNPNTNFEYNNALKIISLDRKLDAIIDNLQTKFNRQKQ